MNCPSCDSVTKVIDSRKKVGFIYRRRKCECGVKFSTKEIAFNVVLPVRDERKKEPVDEVARLEELTKLINEQVIDANASRKGKIAFSTRKSHRGTRQLDSNGDVARWDEVYGQ